MWSGRRDDKTILAYLLLTEELKHFSACSKYRGMSLTIVNNFMLILQCAWTAWLKPMVVLLLSWVDGNWDLKQKCDAEVYFCFLKSADRFVGSLLWFLENNGLDEKDWSKHEDYDQGWTIQHDCTVFSFPLYKGQTTLFYDSSLHEILIAYSRFLHWHAYSYILIFICLIGKVPLQLSGTVKQLQHRHNFQGLLSDV